MKYVIKVEVKCPYCGQPVITDIDMFETPIRGSITEDCPNCGVEVDILRCALSLLERQSAAHKA